jgi:DNA-binding transcriptional regulator YdaS (Cro superfamily)
MHTVTNIDGLLEIMKTLQGEKSQKDFAQTLGVSPSYLNDVYNRRREPGRSITESLGVSATMTYTVPENISTTAATISRGEIHGQVHKENQKRIKAKGQRKSRKRSD